MKVRSTIKKRCAQCEYVKRRGHLYIICKAKPRHKQKQA
ncbi:MAG: 50S ribosomal protein L36 [Candidatus Pacebacteria bacterium]|nr:50S ribosomal protein L36 [Candidatus Paceibacterota bacterium]